MSPRRSAVATETVREAEGAVSERGRQRRRSSQSGGSSDADPDPAVGGRRRRRLGSGRRRLPFTVFMDRDGVLNPNPRIVVRKWEHFTWLPRALEALVRLARPDVRICLATNQPTVGFLTRRAAIDALHARIVADVEAAGGRIDRVEVAYGLGRRRRKPRPGMLEDAAEAFAAAGAPVDKQRAVMVGDKPKDAQAAAAFGIPAILVATTYKRHDLHAAVHRLGLTDVCVVDDLWEAVDEVLARAEAKRA